jgi:hypothetical protein
VESIAAPLYWAVFLAPVAVVAVALAGYLAPKIPTPFATNRVGTFLFHAVGFVLIAMIVFGLITLGVLVFISL